MKLQQHLKISKSNISPYVILPGDPGRVEMIGKFLKKFKIISVNREFKLGVGYYKTKKITVCSTGIGCPSTAIATEELINAGAKYLIRVGTCGGAWKKNIKVGSIIVPTASIRDEGTTTEYIPLGFPAVASTDLIEKIKYFCQKKIKIYYGINRTHDAFYGDNKSNIKWGEYLLQKNWKNYDTPILSSEMECSALFIISTLKNVKAAAILAVNANPESLKEKMYNKNITIKTEKNKITTKKILNKTILIALETLNRID